MARVKNRGQRYDKYWKRFNKLTDDFINGNYHQEELKELSVKVNQTKPDGDYEIQDQAHLLYTIEEAIEMGDDNNGL